MTLLGVAAGLAVVWCTFTMAATQAMLRDCQRVHYETHLLLRQIQQANRDQP